MRGYKLRSAGLCLIVILPLAVGVETPTDSSYTKFRVLGGGGSYASIIRDCEGNPVTKRQYSYRDFGAEISHKLKQPLTIGAKGGYVRDGQPIRTPTDTVSVDKRFFYINPCLSLEQEWFGLGGGILISEEHLTEIDDQVTEERGKALYPSLHLRFGTLEEVYFSTSLYENLPLYSGGGYFDLGVGLNPLPSKLHTWLGLSGGPFDNVGLASKMDVRLNQNWELNARGRYGDAEGIAEWGIAAGLTYNLISK